MPQRRMCRSRCRSGSTPRPGDLGPLRRANDRTRHQLVTRLNGSSTSPSAPNRRPPRLVAARLLGLLSETVRPGQAGAMLLDPGGVSCGAWGRAGASHGGGVSRRAIGLEVREPDRRPVSCPRPSLQSRHYQPQGRPDSAPVQTTARRARPVANQLDPTASVSHGPSPDARAQQPQTMQSPIVVTPAPARAPRPASSQEPNSFISRHLPTQYVEDHGSGTRAPAAWNGQSPPNPSTGRRFPR